MTITDALALLRDGGIVGLMSMALLGGFKGWYVWSREHAAMTKERGEWKSIALQALHVADKVTP